jgi:organic hydroperoxide reductase OsmC/OhrA
MDTHTYNVNVTWMDGRTGEAEAYHVPVPLFFSAPPEFGGAEGFWTPEHLLVLAANSCLMSTMLALAEHNRLTLVGYRADGEGRLEKIPGQGYRFAEIVLRPLVTVQSEEDIVRAEQLLAKAEKYCLVANALSVPVHVDARVEVVATVTVG